MRIGAIVLFSFRLSLDDGIAGFQVGRVSDDRQADRTVRGTIDSFQRRAEVILDIAATFVRRFQLGVELTEDVLERFVTDIRQHVQPPSSTDTNIGSRRHGMGEMT